MADPSVFKSSGHDAADPRGCIAAVDLGSSTFHVLVARIDAGEPRTIARLKFRVRLAAGLDGEGGLTPATWDQARDALLRIADRLGGVPAAGIRAVGTSALRQLAEPEPFLAMAEAILGVPLQIIDGDEEARLIFAGATETLPERPAPRLVVDVGGGSTEIALGSGHVAARVISLNLGCVAVSRAGLAAGTSGAVAMAASLDAARSGLAGARGLDDFAVNADVEVVGTSGTFESVRDVLAARGWCDGVVTRRALERLAAVLAAEPELPLALPGLDEDKEDVLHGGLAILLAVVERLGIERLRWAEGALQDGLLRRVLPLPEDGLRAATLRALRSRFVVDEDGAERVRDVARALMAAGDGSLAFDADDRALMDAAALLHDIGMSVSARQHERHGAWLLRNAELRGFGLAERELLMHLVRGHRGPWPRLGQAALAPDLRRRAERLCVILRLAVVLAPLGVEALPELAAGDGELRIAPNAAWRQAHPWVMERLRDECAQLASAGTWPRPILGDRVET